MPGTWVQWILGSGFLVFIATIVGLVLKKPGDAAQALLSTTESYSKQLADLRIDRDDFRNRLEAVEKARDELRDRITALEVDNRAKSVEIVRLEGVVASLLRYLSAVLAWGRGGGQGPEPTPPPALDDVVGA